MRELTGWQKNLEELLGSYPVEIWGIVATFYALFWPDMNIALIQTSNNVSRSWDDGF